jgi:hypothetical protein
MVDVLRTRGRQITSRLGAAFALLLLAQTATAAPPVVTNPGPQENVEGDPVSLPISATDPDGGSLTYSASGLPRRLEIDPATGVICCNINVADVAGTYTVTVGVSDGSSTTNVQFTWIVTPGTMGSGAILREWWGGVPGTSISDLTSWPPYPDSPDGSDLPTSLQLPAPAEPASTGNRLRGYVHPKYTGSHRFRIAASDSARILLSDSDLPSGASMIASTGGTSTSFDVFLEAGARYYIEVIHKSDTPGEFMIVEWEEPTAGELWTLLGGENISPLDFVPVWGQLKDHGSHEGSPVSETVSASDPNEDPLAYTAVGLPPQLSIDLLTGEISGTIDMGSVGSFPVTVTATDPSGNFAEGQFVWEVVPQDATLIAPVNRGVACQDDATGIGYLLYSIVDVRQSKRFWPNPPVSQNAAHFVCVKFVDGQWYYDNNDAYFPHRLWGSDVLVAEIDYDADTITSLEGQLSTYEGVIRGYESGNIGFVANEYDGEFARGEFSVTGSHFYPASYPIYPELPALPGWSRAALLALILAFGRRALKSAVPGRR